MRKLLLPLLCLILIFNSGEEDDSTTSAAPPPSSTACGNVTLTANSSSYAYNNPHMQIPGECMVLSHVLQETSVYHTTMPPLLLTGSFSDIPLIEM